jgi:hypothetical protein
MEIDLTGSSSDSEDGAAPSISSRQLPKGAVVSGGGRASNDAVDTDEEVMVVGEKILETRLLEGAKHAIDLLDSPV